MGNRERGCLHVGVVGHRPDVFDPRHVEQVRGCVRRALRHIHTISSNVKLISPLAEGADRLVAEEALSLGIPLICLLPFARSEYVRDFESARSIDGFDALLRRAERVIELEGNHHNHPEREAGYAAVSDALLERSDVLLAVWDGKPARGKGGTANSVKGALNRGIPVIWIDVHPPSDIRLLSSHDGEITKAPLEQLFRYLTT